MSPEEPHVPRRRCAS